MIRLDNQAGYSTVNPSKRNLTLDLRNQAISLVSNSKSIIQWIFASTLIDYTYKYREYIF